MRHSSALIGALAVVSLTGCTNPYDPAQRALAGAGFGAVSGAVLGSLAGGGRGAALGALAGAQTGAIAGAATTPPPPQTYYYASPLSAGQLPAQIAEAESLYHGTWTVNGPGSYLAVWDNAATAQMTVVRFDRDAVVIDRVDMPGSSSAGMTALYTGQISPEGNSVINTHVVWTWPGHPGFPAESGWSASW